MKDYWGDPIRWHFTPDALRHSLEGLVNSADDILVAPVEELFGPGAWSSIRRMEFDHFQEGEFQIIFRVTAETGSKEQGVFCLVVAKSPGARSRVAEKEFRALRRVAARVPGVTVRPITSGYVGLREKQRDVSIFCYTTHWLDGYHELGVDDKMNFFINEKPFHHYSPAQTDQIKATILALCLAVYDRERGEAMGIPLIGAGDCVVTRPKRNRPTDVMFICVRGMEKVRNLEACLRLYIDYEGEWGGKVFRLRPADKGLLEDTVTRVCCEEHQMSPEAVRSLLSRVLDSV